MKMHNKTLLMLLIGIAGCANRKPDSQNGIPEESEIGLKAAASDDPFPYSKGSAGDAPVTGPPGWWKCDARPAPVKKPLELKLAQPRLQSDGLGPIMIYPSNYKEVITDGGMAEKDYLQSLMLYSEYYYASKGSFLYFDEDWYLDVQENLQQADDEHKRTYKQKIDDTRNQVKCFLATLLGTNSGRQLLTKLFNAWKIDKSRQVRIVHSLSAVGRNSTVFRNRTGAYIPQQGSSSTIGVTQLYCWENCLLGWDTERPKYGLYHEMIHSYYAIDGTLASGTTIVAYNSDGSYIQDEMETQELQVTGLGLLYDKITPSENVIRLELKKPLRPFFRHQGEQYIPKISQLIPKGR